jgi:hypothetical protein
MQQYGKSPARSLGVGLLLAMVAALVAVPAWAGPALQPRVVEQPAILQTLARIPDHELQELRGRYDSYYFGMDIIVNLMGASPTFAIVYHANMPDGVVTSPTGMSYNGEGVAYQAGIGQGSVFQTVQVTGDGKIVTGLVNIDITIPQSLLSQPFELNLPKGTLEGLAGLQ